MYANQVTREVSGTIDGADFVFKATFESLGNWEAANASVTTPQLWMRVEQGSIRALHTGLMALRVSGSEDTLRNLCEFRSDIKELLLEAVRLAFPEIAVSEDDSGANDSGNADPAGVKT